MTTVPPPVKTPADVAGRTRPQVAAKPRKVRFLEFARPIAWHWTLILGGLTWIAFFGLWELSSLRSWVNPLFMPPPSRVVTTLYELLAERGFHQDILISVYRILVSFLLACCVAIPLGVLMGSFKAIEAAVNPFISAWRYLPAPAFIPLLLMWFGTGEGSKLALLFIGVIFFMITLVMDHTKSVRLELIQTAMTLGAGRAQILATIVLPAVAPKILITMRQMLAVSWTYLVIAEIVASTTGIGSVMMRGQRFLKVDEIMAGIVVIGFLGLMFDYLFRILHRLVFPYLPRNEH